MESEKNVEKVQMRIELKAIEEEKVDLEKERLRLMADVVSTTKHENELKIMFMDTSCIDDT
jgi:hypothetical protein